MTYIILLHVKSALYLSTAFSKFRQLLAARREHYIMTRRRAGPLNFNVPRLKERLFTILSGELAYASIAGAEVR